MPQAGTVCAATCYQHALSVNSYTDKQIGDLVRKGEIIGRVGVDEVTAQIDGIMRGLIRPGSIVTKGLKIGDVDPRGEVGYCDTISEKARALGGVDAGVARESHDARHRCRRRQHRRPDAKGVHGVGEACRVEGPEDHHRGADAQQSRCARCGFRNACDQSLV